MSDGVLPSIFDVHNVAYSLSFPFFFFCKILYNRNQNAEVLKDLVQCIKNEKKNVHGFLFDKNSFKEKRIGPILWDSLEKKVLHLGDKSVMQSLFVFTTSRLKSNDNNAIIQTDFQCFDLASTTWGQFEHLFQPLHSHYLILKRFIIRCVSLWKVEGERHFHLTAIFVTCMSSPLFKSLGW